MSGPKKSDVQAKLNEAANCQRKCANLISRAEDAAITALMRDASAGCLEADAGAEAVRQALGSLTPEMLRVAPRSVQDARVTANQAHRLVTEAKTRLEQANADVQTANRLEQGASQAFARGNQEYERARAALNQANAHYLSAEMEKAKAAERLFEQAAGELAKASEARREASRRAGIAVQGAKEAVSATRTARDRVQSTQAEAGSRLRAEEEANLIAERERRAATLATDQAKASLQRVDSLPHQKFRPGRGDQLRSDLANAEALLRSDQFQKSAAAADRVQDEARGLEQDVAEVLREFERQRTEAEAHVRGLQAAVDGIDADLIREWADVPEALDTAHGSLRRANESLARELFPDAVAQARAATESVNHALHSAAENQSAHEKRQTVGDAIMSVLGDLGFDVSFDPGSRTEPLRIAGQTPDETGRGDFDLAIPLTGEVDFTVESPQGDTSCVAAVEALQHRLAERGITWQTTNWGNAGGVQPLGSRVKTAQTEKAVQTEQQKSKARSG